MSNDLKSPIFKTPQVDIIFSHKNMSCGLNLSQEMTDKIQNESGHFDNTMMRKHKMWSEWTLLVFFFDILYIFSGRNKVIDMIHFNIFSGLFRHKFREPTSRSLAPIMSCKDTNMAHNG